MATATTQNPVLNQNQSIFDSIVGYGERIFGAYSSYMGQRDAAKLAEINAQYYQPIPTSDLYGQQLQTQQNAVSLLVYGGIALALLGVGGLVWKSFKK